MWAIILKDRQRTQRESIADPRGLKLILKYLKAGVILRRRYYEDTDQGLPQGSPPSPLLANILVDELDHELENQGHQFVRDTNDFVILRNSPRARQRILTSIKSDLKKTLKLIVNESKHKVVVLQETTFLGFRIMRKKIRWTEKNQQKFKAEVRQVSQMSLVRWAMNNDWLEEQGLPN